MGPVEESLSALWPAPLLSCTLPQHTPPPEHLPLSDSQPLGTWVCICTSYSYRNIIFKRGMTVLDRAKLWTKPQNNLAVWTTTKLNPISNTIYLVKTHRFFSLVSSWQWLRYCSLELPGWWIQLLFTVFRISAESYCQFKSASLWTQSTHRAHEAEGGTGAKLMIHTHTLHTLSYKPLMRILAGSLRSTSPGCWSSSADVWAITAIPYMPQYTLYTKYQ